MRTCLCSSEPKIRLNVKSVLGSAKTGRSMAASGWEAGYSIADGGGGGDGGVDFMRARAVFDAEPGGAQLGENDQGLATGGPGVGREGPRAGHRRDVEHPAVLGPGRSAWARRSPGRWSTTTMAQPPQGPPRSTFSPADFSNISSLRSSSWASTASTFCLASSTVRPGAERALAPSITLLPSPLSAGGGDPPRHAEVARAQASVAAATREARGRRASAGTGRDHTTRRNDAQRDVGGAVAIGGLAGWSLSPTPLAAIGPARSEVVASLLRLPDPAHVPQGIVVDQGQGSTSTGLADLAEVTRSRSSPREPACPRPLR